MYVATQVYVSLLTLRPGYWQLVLIQYFLNLLVAVRALVLLFGTIVFAVLAIPGASWDLCPRIGIVPILQIRPPTFVATFVAVQIALAF